MLRRYSFKRFFAQAQFRTDAAAIARFSRIRNHQFGSDRGPPTVLQDEDSSDLRPSTPRTCQSIAIADWRNVPLGRAGKRRISAVWRHGSSRGPAR